MSNSTVHKLTTHRTAAQVERVQMNDATLCWRYDATTETYKVEDEVQVTTSDGETITGYVAEVRPNDGQLFVSFS